MRPESAAAVRADLHVHTRYSDRPSEWLLRRIGAPECYTEPLALYHAARRRGMRLVTTTDHNDLRGSLEIAHLPGTFCSVEATTYFPDGCKVHVLIHGLSERQFGEVQRLRASIFEMVAYLRAERLAHGLAHPLYSVNGKLTVAHIEQLIVLFDCWETLNSGSTALENTVVQAIVAHLDGELVSRLADAHGIEPAATDSWRKGTIGGSDDHSGLFIARASTAVELPHDPAAEPTAAEVSRYLDAIRDRRTSASGQTETALSFAHALYATIFQYYRGRFLGNGAGDARAMLMHLGAQLLDTSPRTLRLSTKVRGWADRLRRAPKPAEASFRTLLTVSLPALAAEWSGDGHIHRPELADDLNRRTFQLVSKLANQLIFQFTRKAVKKVGDGSLFGSLQAVSAMAPVALSVSPYLISFRHHHLGKPLYRDASIRLTGIDHTAASRPKRAWFTDTFADLNGVAITVQTMARTARLLGDELTVVTSTDAPFDSTGLRVENFPPVGALKLPENDSFSLAFPPLLDLVAYCERERFTHLIVSTPGPVGLCALAVAKLLNLPVSGVYHTDLPAYIGRYTDDDGMVSLGWRGLRAFYDEMDAIYVPSRDYLRQLIGRGFDPTKLRLFPHGVDADRFSPAWRTADFWTDYGAPTNRPIAAYLGRVAVEKDLDTLADGFRQLIRLVPDVVPVVVGDGPGMGELRRRLVGVPVVFTGFLTGERFSRAMASTDVMLFPSTTDTFGNVVLEAQSAGVPVVAADAGGPRDILIDGVTGLLVPPGDARALAEAAARLLLDEPMRQRFGRAAHERASRQTWARVYADFVAPAATQPRPVRAEPEPVAAG